MPSPRLAALAGGPLPADAQTALLELDPNLGRHMPGNPNLSAETLAAIWPKLNQAAAIRALRFIHISRAHFDAVLASGEQRVDVLHTLLDLKDPSPDQWEALAASAPPGEIASRLITSPDATPEAKAAAANLAELPETAAWFAHHTRSVSDAAVTAVIDRCVNYPLAEVPQGAAAQLAFVLADRPVVAAYAATQPMTAPIAARTLYSAEVHDRIDLDNATAITVAAIIEDPVAPDELRERAWRRWFEPGVRGFYSSIAPPSTQPSTGGVPIADVADRDIIDSLLWRPPVISATKRRLVTYELANNPHLTRYQLDRLLELLDDDRPAASFVMWEGAVQAVLARLPGVEPPYHVRDQLKGGTDRALKAYRDRTSRLKHKPPKKWVSSETVQGLQYGDARERYWVASLIRDVAKRQQLTPQGWKVLGRIIDAPPKFDCESIVALAKAGEHLDDDGVTALATLLADGMTGTPAELVSLVDALR